MKHSLVTPVEAEAVERLHATVSSGSASAPAFAGVTG